MSCMVTCAVMLYCRLVTVPEDALQMFAVRRCPPNMPPSQLRYLYYYTNIIKFVKLNIYKYQNVVAMFVCMYVNSSITRESIEQFQPNLVHMRRERRS